jgi:hypothetical protein
MNRLSQSHPVVELGLHIAHEQDWYRRLRLDPLKYLAFLSK